MAKRLIDTRNISREEWLEFRRRGMGSSDAPAILGVSPWGSPLSVYCDKLGITEPIEELERMEWGKILEAPIADKYAEKTGRTVEIEPFMLAHPKYSFMLANLDRIIRDPDKGEGVLEIKTTSAFSAKEWEEEAPLYPQVQLQHQLAITGLTWGSIVVLIGGQKLHWIDYERNDPFISVLIEKEAEFWQMVENRIPPPPDSQPATVLALKSLYPKDTGETIPLPPDAIFWAEQLETAKETKKAAKTAITLLENKIKSVMGTATYGILPDGTKYQWKWQKRAAYVVAESEARIFRRLKGKG